MPTLLESSLPQKRGGWFWYASGLFLLLVLVSTYAERAFPAGRSVVELLSSVSMLALIVGMGATTWMAARAVQREHGQLAAIEELIQLRRWGEAGLLLQELLDRPTRTLPARTQGLIFLAAVLARFHRFADAVSIYEHLLDLELLDSGGAHGLRLGRAMALLHEERLYDADRAIAELRRTPQAGESGGLALVEIYRDVKTGHPQEAIELFEQKKELIRRQLGPRIADAYALIARAHDLQGNAELARAAYEKATLLAPEAELQRRYAEVAALLGKYAASAAPVPASAEAA